MYDYYFLWEARWREVKSYTPGVLQTHVGLEQTQLYKIHKYIYTSMSIISVESSRQDNFFFFLQARVAVPTETRAAMLGHYSSLGFEPRFTPVWTKNIAIGCVLVCLPSCRRCKRIIQRLQSSLKVPNWLAAELDPKSRTEKAVKEAAHRDHWIPFERNWNSWQWETPSVLSCSSRHRRPIFIRRVIFGWIPQMDLEFLPFLSSDQMRKWRFYFHTEMRRI